jgi:hypothetical protein
VGRSTLKTHGGNAVGYLRHGGLGTLVADAGLTIHAQRPSAGGNITLAVLGASDDGSSTQAHREAADH